MRTTLDIREDVLLEYKRLAAEAKRPLKQVIEDALRGDLARRREAISTATDRPVITFRGRGLRPGVSLDSGSDLRELMDERE